MGPTSARVILALSLAALLLPGPAAATTTTSDTVAVDPSGRSTAEIALEVARLDDRTGVDTVLIGRDDVFADALAAGVIAAPLLLVPSEGPVPADVLAELARLEPGRVVILGGEAAVAPAVADQLTDGGYTVERRFGPTRVDTAVDIARNEAPQATTALLARADAGAGSTEPTRAFADALAGGAWAAADGIPVLLTPTAALATSTRDYLQTSAVTRVVILGGTAAVSAEVEAEVAALVDEVDRAAGADRFATAVDIATFRGAPSSASVERVILAEAATAESWAGGFGLASVSARLQAPVLLTAGDALPAATVTWLEGQATFAGPAPGAVLTCLARASACGQARGLLGLPDVIQVGLTPAPGQPINPGSEIAVGLPADTEATIGGTCLDEPVDTVGPVTVVASADLALPCTIQVVIALDPQTTQTTEETYSLPSLDDGARFQQLSVRADGEPSQEQVGDENVAIAADGGYAVYASGNPNLVDADEPLNGFFQIYRSSLGGFGQTLLTVGVDAREGDFHSEMPTVSADGRRVLFSSRASNLVPDDTNDARDVFLWDDGTIRAVSTLPGSTELLPGGGEVPVISDDGDWAILRTFGGFMPGADPSDTDGLVLVNLETDERVLVDPSGSIAHDLSADGRFVVYESFEGIKRFDRDTGETIIVSVDPNGFGDSQARQPSVTADGSLVLFSTGTDLLGDGQGSGGTDLYVFDAAGDELRRVNPAGVEPGDPFGVLGNVALAGDGSAYAVASGTDLDGAGDEWIDTFVVQIDDGTTTRVSTAPGDPGGDSFVGGAQGLSQDGDRAVLLTNGFNLPLVPGIQDFPGIDPALHAVGAAVP